MVVRSTSDAAEVDGNPIDGATAGPKGIYELVMEGAKVELDGNQTEITVSQ